MVIRLNNGQVHIVNNLNDVKALVDPELFEAMTTMMSTNGDPSIADKYESLDKEFRSYESTVEDYSSTLMEVKDELEAISQKLVSNGSYTKSKASAAIDRLVDKILMQI